MEGRSDLWGLRNACRLCRVSEDVAADLSCLVLGVGRSRSRHCGHVDWRGPAKAVSCSVGRSFFVDPRAGETREHHQRQIRRQGHQYDGRWDGGEQGPHQVHPTG